MIYLDYIATTPVADNVKKSMDPYLRDKYGNPSSIHQLGQEAIVAVDEARDTLAKFLNAEFSEVYFTGSATEADNWAIRGVVEEVAIRHKFELSDLHVVSSAIEHKAVLKTLEYLEKNGLQVTYIQPDKQGFVTSKQIENNIQSNTILVSVMMVNNEVGSLLPIKNISNVIQNENKKREQEVNDSEINNKLPVYFHNDAVQAAQFYNLNVRNLGVDLLTMSAHKMYGPKGVGSLYVRSGTSIQPLIFGGGQEDNLRSGTENVSGIAGFGQAVKELQNKQNKIKETIGNLQKRLWGGLSQIEGVSLVGPELGESRVPNNISVHVSGVSAESLIIALDQEGFAIASGSACTTGTVEPSHVLLAMGYDHKAAGQVIRISLGRPTTQEEIDEFLQIFPKVVHRLRG